MLTEITYRKSQHIVACMFTKGQSGILDHDEILDSSGNCCILTKTGMANRTKAAAYALRHGLLAE